MVPESSNNKISAGTVCGFSSSDNVNPDNETSSSEIFKSSTHSSPLDTNSFIIMSPGEAAKEMNETDGSNEKINAAHIAAALIFFATSLPNLTFLFMVVFYLF